jgi:hypothetical protein
VRVQGTGRADQGLVLGLKLLGPVVVEAAMCGAVTAMSAVSRVLEGDEPCESGCTK